MRGSIHLRSISLELAADRTGFPFDVPVVRALRTLAFDAPVTFFVGENGSGKSTLLEAIAVKAELPTIGAAPAQHDPTLAPQRALADALKATWSRRVRRGFFLRAEDFFGFARRVAELRADLTTERDARAVEYADTSPLTRALALAPSRGSLAELERRYGDGLDARSHGESFLELFRARFVPGGLYLMDEPEAALSPQSQLGLLAMMGEMVAQGAQFIVATHAPIVLAYPGARICSFEGGDVTTVAYDDLEHVALTRAFLRDPAAFTRRLGLAP